METPPQSENSVLRNTHIHGDRWKSVAKMKAEGPFPGNMTITSHRHRGPRTEGHWPRDWSGNKKGQDMFSDLGNKPPYTSTVFSPQTTCLSFTCGTEEKKTTKVWGQRVRDRLRLAHFLAVWCQASYFTSWASVSPPIKWWKGKCLIKFIMPLRTLHEPIFVKGFYSPSSAITSSVTMGKFFHLSLPQFSHL